MREVSRNQKVGVVAAVAIVGGIVGLRAMQSAQQPSLPPGVTLRETLAPAPVTPAPSPPANESKPDTTTQTAAASKPESPREIVVHVAGAVKQPGVYHLPPGSRGDDALKAAGGPTQDANTEAINLAAPLEDGTQLHFPTRKEQPAPIANPDNVVTASAAKSAKPAVKTAANPTAKGAGKAATKNGGKSGKLTNPSQGQVNINTAGWEELQRLPGIGPSMAERVIDYRKENGGFQAPEDLLQVSGIGQKKFAKMQPFIKVR